MLITILKYIFTTVFMIFLIILAVGSMWLNYERKLEERENERKIQQTDKTGKIVNVVTIFPGKIDIRGAKC